ncbi:hybrid sensor histidine kinase/response regulator [Spirulina sp. CS-785/01]|uniref:hybrid sensor histidine kinase/response regulator n=1 Tax=Spirulina sp. CS-785/01 TaxID=3021716 RepID=UPI00232F8CB9|nr:hybrid sensor histidine kinase/response regulator [Spirulina sp. CS-785/01]MDB9314162.1 hybrid sensor histidine kinase/response regulator [Spirulina sp. CS-785/01]
MTSHLADILIVDDIPENLRLLSTMLQEKGYKVRKSISGRRALQVIETIPPDLILLDIRMPELDGYDVCKILKQKEDTRNIPIIFISALNDPTDKVNAFEVGGVDYITKPFQLQEVLARVENHLKICQLQQKLHQQNQQLQQEIRDRTKAENTLRVYLHAVSHDLRNPVVGMSMVLNTLLEKQQNDHLTLPRKTVQRMTKSCDRQLNLINSLVETNEIEIWGVHLDPSLLHLHEFLNPLIADWQPILEKNRATLTNNIPPDLPPIHADGDQLWRVYENLIGNALKHNPPGITINLDAKLEDSQHIIASVSDNGYGIDPQKADTLFELYQRGENTGRTVGLGLGLYLCRQIIVAHGGEMGITNPPQPGSTFWFSLPTLQETVP